MSEYEHTVYYFIVEFLYVYTYIIDYYKSHEYRLDLYIYISIS